jgi:hypothetical protein
LLDRDYHVVFGVWKTSLQVNDRVVAKQVSGKKSRRIGDEKRSLLAVNEYRKPQSNNEFEPETLFRNSSDEICVTA